MIRAVDIVIRHIGISEVKLQIGIFYPNNTLPDHKELSVELNEARVQ